MYAIMYAIKYATKINFLSENIRSKFKKKPLFINKPFTPVPKMLRLDMIKSVKEYLDMPIQYYASANLIISGDWDIECIYKFENNESQVELSDNLLIVWKTVLQLYKYNYNFTECDQYIKYCYEKKDKNIISQYFLEQRKMYEDMRINGYKTQAQLFKKRHWSKSIPGDEIPILIGRDGEFVFLSRCANHRIRLAQILGIVEVPVIIWGIHEEFAYQLLMNKSRFKKYSEFIS